MAVFFSVTLPLCAALLVPESAVRHLPQLGRVASTAVFDPLGLHGSAERPAQLAQPAVLALGVAAFAAAQPEAAFAAGGEYGIFEGRIVSLAHPTVMALCYGATAWAAFTGFQWRRLRELGTQIADLKEELKGSQAKLAALGEGVSNPALAVQISALQDQVNELSATRKNLVGDDFRTKHYQASHQPRGRGARLGAK